MISSWYRVNLSIPFVVLEESEKKRKDLGGALAAHLLALGLRSGLDGVHDLHEGGHHGGGLRVNLHQSVGGADGGSQVRLVSAVAAAGLGARLTSTSVASRTLADELALGLGASDGLLALPVALGGLAHGSAHGVGGLALSAAVSRRADSLALGAILLLAEILGATHIALGLVAVNLALGALGLLAVDLALGALAHRVAHSRAHRVVALPSALGVAVALDLSLHEVGVSHDSREGQGR